MVDVAVMGYGVVGSGVVEILTERADIISKNAKEEINLKYILDIRDFKDSPFADKFIKDFDTILNDDDVKVVVEVIGGLTPAFDFVSKCLKKGKSVVTSNKELVAKKGAQLIRLAQENNANFLFEASVGGGIPIIRPLTQCLIANEILEITGILNGTTNFILTKMVKEGYSFEDALKTAQKLGYAERDPSADIDGHDACRKICILSTLVLGKHIYPEEVYTKGIRNITLKDVEYADKAGYVIKLIAQAKRAEGSKLEAVVEPMLISQESQLANVNDVFNAILVKGDSTGDVMFYGKGAGKLPTASAVVADVIDCVKHIKARKYLFWEDTEKTYVADHNESISSFYIRIKYTDEENTEKTVNTVFGDKCRLVFHEKNKDCVILSNKMSVKEANERIKRLKDYGIDTEAFIRINDN